MARKLILIMAVVTAALVYEGITPQVIKQDIKAYSRQSVRAMTGMNADGSWGA
ncbi:hypothetical protein [Novosphingobium album (ex Hu et al. 2023)]|uniref:Uncharacterized protein n=1 Tax=Novosphingobium album (ex Hu et al. 2023) TaxID=2930093 RepID=A0ABT0B0L1_9SPHN|nr:hypothetical protein [Novosphingobium album (ex Hu et al. 2023)]MCJ2178572.1 hypothetical protein [Novosphingobium album (ex Hu et al. 2023)]